MAKITYGEAIQAALREEMQRNSRVFVMGQDVELVMWGGDAQREFGRERVRSTPISETGFIGAGIGAALTGMIPIIELGCANFLYSAMDQIVNQAARLRYMFGGQAKVPMVIRAPVFCGFSFAGSHSDRPWGLFAQAPGLKIIVPSSPYDIKGLLKSAIRDGNPVLCFEDATLGKSSGEVPEEEYTIPIGLADIKRTGSDITIVAIAAAVNHSLVAALQLADEGISVEVVDVRSVAPLDRHTILDSVIKTGRLIVVDPAPSTCSLAAEIAATVAESAFESLKCPVIRLTAPDIPAPFSQQLERLMYPTVDDVVSATRRLFANQRSTSITENSMSLRFE